MPLPYQTYFQKVYSAADLMAYTFLPTLSRPQLFQRTSARLQSVPVISVPTEPLLCCHFWCNACAKWEKRLTKNQTHTRKAFQVWLRTISK